VQEGSGADRARHKAKAQKTRAIHANPTLRPCLSCKQDTGKNRLNATASIDVWQPVGESNPSSQVENLVS
jgi:hypothetical protein